MNIRHKTERESSKTQARTFDEMLRSLQILIAFIQSGLAILAGYLMVLTAASRRAPQKTELPPGEPACRFLIIIPAHNEERLIGETLDNIALADYPPSLYSVHVVADNCTDQTAEIAKSKGAVVHIRQNKELIGKGYALQWLLARIWEENIPHDALVFLDADSVISPNFLRVMAARIQRGERVIQAYYAVRKPEQSWAGALRYAALAVLHYLRPQGRMVLGGSAGLKGNGMVFKAEVMKQYSWSASLTEDIELHMALVLNGERVTFAPDAVVYGEMPNTLTQMHSQHMRWEQGRLEMARRYVPPLAKSSWRALKNGERGKAYMQFDAIMEHIIPPFSVLAGLSGLLLLANLILFGAAPRKNHKKQGRPGQTLAKANLLASIGIAAAQILYLFSGLRQVGAPKEIYLKLLYAPLLIVWKLKQYAEAIFTRKQPSWIRTERNEV